MNINSKAYKQKRTPRKALRNARHQRNLAIAEENGGHDMGDYVGRVPEYKNIAEGKAVPPMWIKVRSGVPFVRKTLR